MWWKYTFEYCWRSNSRVCAPNKVKNMYVKVFDSMSWEEKTKFLVKDELRCKCTFNEKVCSLKQKWNHN